MKKLLQTFFKITNATVRDMNTFQEERAEFYILLGFVLKTIYKPLGQQGDF